MRLIDGDALCVHIEEEFDGVCVYDVSGNEAAREFCDIVDDAPTIDAIPVEWLRGLMIEYANINTREHASYAYCLSNVIEGWRKEQEAR